MAAVVIRGVNVRLGGRAIFTGVDLNVGPGEAVAVEGTSGAGKSTLLHVVAGLIRPESGSVEIGGERIDRLSDRRRSAVRLRLVGSVFQFGELLPEFNVIENVELPLRLLGWRREPAHERALACLREVGIEELAKRSLAQVSGGQMQRAAIARAVAHDPRVILADEPTGSLDPEAAEHVMQLLTRTSRRHDAGLIVVTHDRAVSAQCDRTLRLSGGLLQADGARNAAST